MPVGARAYADDGNLSGRSEGICRSGGAGQTPLQVFVFVTVEHKLATLALHHGCKRRSVAQRTQQIEGLGERGMVQKHDADAALVFRQNRLEASKLFLAKPTISQGYGRRECGGTTDKHDVPPDAHSRPRWQFIVARAIALDIREKVSFKRMTKKRLPHIHIVISRNEGHVLGSKRECVERFSDADKFTGQRQIGQVARHNHVIDRLLRDIGQNRIKQFGRMRGLPFPQKVQVSKKTLAEKTPKRGVGQVEGVQVRQVSDSHGCKKLAQTDKKKPSSVRSFAMKQHETRTQPQTLPPNVLETLACIVGSSGLILDEASIEPYLTEPRGNFRGRTEAVVLPSSTEQLSQVVAACAQAGVQMVPAGGGTGLCGGAVPSPLGDQIVIGLGRMKKIRALDPAGFTITVEAGCILADIQHAARQAGLLFPLSLGAEGSCHIGGNLATNAGGTQVMRYGSARDLALGLEIVLPDGQILDLLRGLRKDNTGYHLAGLFCGAEGTLGFISAAVLKLFPLPQETVTAWVAIPNVSAAIELLSILRAGTGDALTALEFVPRIALDMVLKHIPGTRDPFSTPYPHYVLIEAASGFSDGQLARRIETLLSQAAEENRVLDATFAQHAAQAKALWHLRESIPEAQKPEGRSIKHDVSLPISQVPLFVEQATRLCERYLPGCRVVAFGHVGDGNVHFNVSEPLHENQTLFWEKRHDLSKQVHDLAMSMNGSFSAEHGIGQLKRQELQAYRSPVELEVMRKLKQALDPQGLLNPGKVL